MKPEQIILRYYTPSPGTEYFIYRIFNGTLIALTVKIPLAELVTSYVWPSQQMSASLSDTTQSS